MTLGGIQPSANTYAGDVSIKEAWDLLTSDPKSVLIDIRTAAEWAYVGGPDLSALNKDALRISWQLFPDMSKNPDFLCELSAAVPDKETTLLFLCRSGVRSISSSISATAAGFANSFNVLNGFEGDKDDISHRGSLTGWKAESLPWKQS